MALFQKKRDPILEQEARLKNELAAVEARIRKLDAELRRQAGAGPKPRSSARPGRTEAAPAGPPVGESGLEDLRPPGARNPFDAGGAPARFNARGVARFDLPATVRRGLERLRGRPPRNPRLVTYLAAGGIEGLPALRHERRVARNRFLLACGGLMIVFLGIFYWWMR